MGGPEPMVESRSGGAAITDTFRPKKENDTPGSLSRVMRPII